MGVGEESGDGKAAELRLLDGGSFPQLGSQAMDALLWFAWSRQAEEELKWMP